jgi:NADPH:quinone reductase-like Zn-dependent oxidoreductase
MRAAVLPERGASPRVHEFDEPAPSDGDVLIHVQTAGLGGWDILGRYMLPVSYPCVVRGEGVGRTDDGRRVYFGERSVPPFGAWAERTIVPSEEVWDVPDGIDDKLAITMAIAGTGALVPLESANIKTGESVLIVGATGAVGQIALRLARHLGAGRVVGAARSDDALARLLERGLADAVVTMGTGDDTARLKDEAGEGFDVVLDMIYGDAFLAALKATRPGARVVTMGAQETLTTNLNIVDLFSRTHTCIGTGHLPPAERRAIWERLLDLAREKQIEVDYTEFTLEQSAEAWSAQRDSPRAKVVARIS